MNFDASKDLNRNVQKTMLERTQLLNTIFDVTMDIKVVCIKAGAGFGKSVLISQIEKKIEHYIFYTGMRECHDFHLFIKCLIYSMKSECSIDFKNDCYETFEDEYNGLLQVIYNQHHEFAIIFDDVHKIVEPEIVGFIKKLCENPPENAKIIVSGRGITNCGMANIFQCLTENILHKPWFLNIGIKDLRISKNEAKKILGDDFEKYMETTGGWPICLEKFVDDNNAEVYEDIRKYAIDEVLDSLPEHIRTFILKTVHLDCISNVFCDFAGNFLGTQKELDAIYENIGILEKKSESEYAYLNVFKNAALELGKEYKNATFSCMADFYYSMGDIHGFLECCKKGECPWVAAKMLEDNGISMIEEKGRLNDVKNAFDFLEHMGIPLTVKLKLVKGIYYSASGYFIIAEKYLRVCIDKYKSEYGNEYIIACVHLARTLRDVPDFEKSDFFVKEALQCSEKNGLGLSYIAGVENLENMLAMHRGSEALDLCNQYVNMCKKNSQINESEWFLRYLSRIYFALGDYRKCIEHYERFHNCRKDKTAFLKRYNCFSLAAISYFYFGKIDKSRKMLKTGIENLLQSGYIEEVCSILMSIAQQKYMSWKDSRQEQDMESAEKYAKLALSYCDINRKNAEKRPAIELFLEMLQVHKNSTPDVIKALDNIVLKYQKTKNPMSTLESLICEYNMGELLLEKGRLDGVEMLWNVTSTIQTDGIQFNRIALFSLEIIAFFYIINDDKEKASKVAERFLDTFVALDYTPGFDKFKMSLIFEYCKYNHVAPNALHISTEKAGYVFKKVYLKGIGEFCVYGMDSNNLLCDKPLEWRTEKCRQLAAFLYMSGTEGATKNEIIEHIWFEYDDKKNLTALFNTTLYNLRILFKRLGVENVVTYTDKKYKFNYTQVLSDISILYYIMNRFYFKPNGKYEKMLHDVLNKNFMNDINTPWVCFMIMDMQQMFRDFMLVN